MVRVFTNDPGDQGSFARWVIPKSGTWCLLAITPHNKVRINGKKSISREKVDPFPTSRRSSHWKRSLRVTFDYGRPTSFIHIYIYIYISWAYWRRITTNIYIRYMRKCQYNFINVTLFLSLSLYIYIYMCVCVCVKMPYLLSNENICTFLFHLLLFLLKYLIFYIQMIVYVNHIYQPLRSGRIWHKVNFLSGV